MWHWSCYVLYVSEGQISLLPNNNLQWQTARTPLQVWCIKASGSSRKNQRNQENSKSFWGLIIEQTLLSQYFSMINLDVIFSAFLLKLLLSCQKWGWKKDKTFQVNVETQVAHEWTVDAQPHRDRPCICNWEKWMNFLCRETTLLLWCALKCVYDVD